MSIQQVGKFVDRLQALVVVNIGSKERVIHPPSTSIPAESPAVLAHREGLLVVSKPAGMNLHPVQNSNGWDLQTWLQGQEPDLPSYRPLHRLDKATSGLVMFGERGEVQRQIQRWLADHLVQKTYLSLLHGRPPEHGTNRTPLPDQRRGRALPAETRWEVLEQFQECALVELFPSTGRKHQLRRHTLAAGHGIVGDSRYKAHDSHRQSPPEGRLWLHAWRLELPNGWSFEAPVSRAWRERIARLRGEAP